MTPNEQRRHNAVRELILRETEQAISDGYKQREAREDMAAANEWAREQQAARDRANARRMAARHESERWQRARESTPPSSVHRATLRRIGRG
jgi:hypothetical protein